MFDAKNYHREYGKHYYLKTKGKVTIIACPDCGESKPRYRGGRCQRCFFSRQLRQRAEKRVESVCKQCGASFLKRTTLHRFCSQKCSDASRWTFRESKQEGKCGQCGKDFVKSNGFQKFCSGSCKERHRRALATRTPRVTAIIKAQCEYCHAEFSQPKRYYEKRNSKRAPKFCSPRCTYLSRRGKSSPLYRGPANTTRGVTWKDIAKAARDRDGKACRICKSVSKRALPVDHVIPERLMVKWGLFAHAMENLLTLCMSCHGKKTYAETLLLRGDMIGFKSELNRLGYPENAVRMAFKFAGVMF